MKRSPAVAPAAVERVAAAAPLYPAGYNPEHVPTADELALIGLARPVTFRDSTRMLISAEGHALLGEVMARNAAAWRAASGDQSS